MCGIVGMITKNRFGFSHPNIKVFEQLLFLDTLRGDDSTGVFAVNNLGNVGVAKGAVTGEQFIKTKEWGTFSAELFRNGWAVIGHNRKATRGKVTDENAHPFWVDDKLVLVHNGSYYGSHNHLKNTEVDSHAIAHTLAEHGSDDIEGALKKINAAYALVWYDIEKKQLNVIRNSQRPLHFVETSDAWYFASEYQMLEFVLSRERIKIEDAVYSFVEHELNYWTLKDDHSSEVDTVKLNCEYKYSQPPQVSPKSGSVHHMGMGMCHFPDIDRPAPPVVASHVRLVSHTPSPSRKVESNGAILTSDKVPLFPWMKTHTMAESRELFEKYKSGTKINVMVDDYIVSEDDCRYFTVTGSTLDEYKVPVAFNVTKELLDSLTNTTTAQVENATFEITISHPGWRRTDKRTDIKNIDTAEGVMMVIGKEPILRFDGRGHGVQ